MRLLRGGDPAPYDNGHTMRPMHVPDGPATVFLREPSHTCIAVVGTCVSQMQSSFQMIGAKSAQKEVIQ